jgi:hypothetical protein
MAKRLHKPIYLGRGYTPVHVTVCLSAKAWAKATKGRGTTCDYPSDLDASCTHFPADGKLGPASIITLSSAVRKRGDVQEIICLLAHEAVHVKQRCEELMGTTFDHETEAYLVQHIAGAAYRAIAKL